MNEFSVIASEAEEVASRLDLVYDAIVVEIEALPPALWHEHSDQNSWSPAEIVEHVVLAQKAMETRIRSHLEDRPDSHWVGELQARRELLLKVLPSEGQVQASPEVSTFQGVDQREASSILLRLRASFRQLLTECSKYPMKAICWRHGIFGDLNGSLWLLYIPLHAERHLRQLRRSTNRLHVGT